MKLHYGLSMMSQGKTPFVGVFHLKRPLNFQFTAFEGPFRVTLFTVHSVYYSFFSDIAGAVMSILQQYFNCYRGCRPKSEFGPISDLPNILPFIICIKLPAQ